MKTGRLFLSYCALRLRLLLLLGAFAGVFAGVFSLYGLPAEAVGYGTELCAALGAVIFAGDFLRYRNRVLSLRRMEGSVSLSLDRLPPARDPVEREYQELLRILHRNKAELAARTDREMNGWIEYLTLWAHQIKTPMAAMSLLLEGREDETSSALSAELFRVGEYVEMVLQYLRLGGAAGDYVLREQELDPIARGAVRKYARLFIQKGIRLDYSELGRRVLTDEKWLQFVVEQLLSNALKYTPGGGTISVYMAQNAPCTLVVGDTGIGIAPEDLPRVFERGFTGYNGRADKKSTGIGLYLSRRVMEKLSHGISIQSEPGRGTRVLLDLSAGPRAEE